MHSITRRDFSLLVAGSALARGAQSAALPVRPLGKIGFRAAILAFGAQRIGEPRSSQEITDRIVAEGIEQGLNYIDTAPNYGVSEERLGRALKGKRDKVFLSTKIETPTKSQAMEQIRESLKRLQTDHLDCVQIHNIARTDRWSDLDLPLSANGALAALREARKQGMIRHIGCTTHTAPSRVIRAMDTGEIEILTCVLNFVDRHIYRLEETLLPEARKRNIPVIAMKALGGPLTPKGAKLATPQDYRAALRYVWGLRGVSAAIIGFRSPEELREGLAAAREFKPLDAAEMREVTARGKTLAGEWGPTRGAVAA
ncbi:MAG: aldo/keto reductase [Bryobacteraceae bacterium]